MRQASKGIAPSLSADGQQDAAAERHRDAERLASLAALTFHQQRPGLCLPAILAAPPSYTLVQGQDKALVLSQSLVRLGLGGMEKWDHSRGNGSLFAKNSIDGWLNELGADKLPAHISLDFAILDSVADKDAPDGKLFILIETNDGCGLLEVGNAVDELERDTVGLGRAFYMVLESTMRSWMQVYGRDEASYFFERWRESIEMDMEGEEGKDLTFGDYCQEKGIVVPEGNRGCPASICVTPRKRDNRRAMLRMLREHRSGRFSKWIEPVLAMLDVRCPKRRPNEEEEFSSSWDDGPMPNWVLAFSRDDAVNQAFDEESQSMHECSREPVWIDTFDPADLRDVRRVLTMVKCFVEVNLQLVRLCQTLAKDAKERNAHGCTHRPQLHGELRAA